MSGGSLNYLYCAEFTELFDRTNQLERVERELKENGYDDIAQDVRDLIDYCSDAAKHICVFQEQLSDIFQAVEWKYSSDYSREEMIKHFEEYRKHKTFHKRFMYAMNNKKKNIVKVRIRKKR